MSVVTTAILVWEHEAPDPLVVCNAHFGQRRGFVEVSEYGGDKVMEHGLAIGVFNHLNVEALARAVVAAKWENPEYVQLLVRGQYDDQFANVPLQWGVIRGLEQA